MLPLKSLPKILRHATPQSDAHPTTTPDGHLAPPSTHPNRPLAAISGPDAHGPASASSITSGVSSLATEEKELRERLIVLEEQRFFVGEMLADAQRRRKFEEAEALAGNLGDLGREIDAVVGMLGEVDREVERAFLEVG